MFYALNLNSWNNLMPPLVPFDDKLPHLAHIDVCKILITEALPELNGLYDLVDLYCQEAGCDCRKVTIVVMDRQKRPRATIGYGWESPAFYRKWGLDPEGAWLLCRGYLDPLCYQSRHAELFLEAVLSMLRDAPESVDKFKRRYGMFKDAVSPKKRRPVRNTAVPLNSNRSK